jgi:hypothetical protein
MLPPLIVSTLRCIHVLVSIAALLAGIGFTAFLTKGRFSRTTSVWFLALTFLTSLTALVIHPFATGPAHIGGFVSIAILLLATIPLGIRHPTVAWRCVHAACGLAAFYINALAAVVTAFQFEPHLRQLTPTLAHPPLSASQLTAAVTVPTFSLSLAVLTVAFGLAACTSYVSIFKSTRPDLYAK